MKIRIEFVLRAGLAFTLIGVSSLLGATGRLEIECRSAETEWPMRYLRRGEHALRSCP